MSQRIVHEAAGHLRIPVINTGEETKENSGGHHIVEVANHIISIVKVQIRQVEGQRESGETTNSEHWQEGRRPDHWHGETD